MPEMLGVKPSGVGGALRDMVKTQAEGDGRTVTTDWKVEGGGARKGREVPLHLSFRVSWPVGNDMLAALASKLRTPCPELLLTRASRHHHVADFSD